MMPKKPLMRVVIVGNKKEPLILEFSPIAGLDSRDEEKQNASLIKRMMWYFDSEMHPMKIRLDVFIKKDLGVTSDWCFKIDTSGTFFGKKFLEDALWTRLQLIRMMEKDYDCVIRELKNSKTIFELSAKQRAQTVTRRRR